MGHHLGRRSSKHGGGGGFLDRLLGGGHHGRSRDRYPEDNYRDVQPPVAPTVNPGGIQCASCNQVNSNQAKFCSNCGNSMAAQQPSTCKQCGNTLAPNTKFCGNCGAAQ